MKRVLLLVFYLCFFSAAFAQGDLRQMWANLSSAKTNIDGIKACKQLVRHYAHLDGDSAFHYAERGLKYALDARRPVDQGVMLAQMALVDQAQGRTDIARMRVAEALEKYTEANFAIGMAEMTSDLSSFEFDKGNFDVASKYIHKALRIYDSLGNKEGLMTSYKRLSSIFMMQGDSVNTIKYLKLGEAVSKDVPVTNETIELYNLIGVFTVVAMHDSDRALEIFQNDLELSTKKGLERSRVECLIYLGNFYIDAGMPDKAMRHLQDGLKIARERKMLEMESNLLLMMAVVVKENDKQEAMSYLQQALDICERMHNHNFKLTVYNEMVGLYKEEGRYKEALSVIETRNKLKDSMFNISRVKEMASINSAYQWEKSEQKVKHLEQESAENARERNLTIAVAIVITAILVLLIIFYRRSRMLNARLKAQEHELRESNAMKDKLFSIIGHDLRGPIAMIPAILFLYEQEESEPEEKQKLLDGLKQHVDVSLATLDKLLCWGQSLIKGVQMEPQRFNAKEYISGNIELKRMQAQEKQIEITDRTAPVQLYADPTHFDFIIRNLLANAVKYSNKGGKVEIFSAPGSKAGYAVIGVRDNGIGIAKDAIASVFQPTHSRQGTLGEQGTGIGLMVCKEFAKQDGGDIWVESEPGKGATFYLSVRTAA